MTITNMTTALAGQRHGAEYDAFIQRMNDRFRALACPLFQTDAAGLYEAYLASFEGEHA